MKLESIEIENYKGFRKYYISFKDINILTGKNNSGKSTVISAFRLLEVALKKRNKNFHKLNFLENLWGFVVPKSTIPISTENAINDYQGGFAKIKFNFTNYNYLYIIFNEDSFCFLAFEPWGEEINNSSFKKRFPLSVLAIPHLGPLEHNEHLVEKETVMSNLTTHRASRNFRSYWYYFPEKFELFSKMIQETWPGMEIELPEILLDNKNKIMVQYCKENRMTREVFWFGVGFQVWCQILTHISRAEKDDLIVLDEPEIYLHPDIQVKLIEILRQTNKQIIIATHSSDIIKKFKKEFVLIIDKFEKRSYREND